MPTLKPLTLQVVSFSLITLLAVPLGLESRPTVPDNTRASPRTQPTGVMSREQSSPNGLTSTSPSKVTYPAEVTWHYEGHIAEGGQRRLNHLSMIVSPRKADGSPSAVPEPALFQPIKLEWPAPPRSTLGAAASAQSSISVNISPQSATAGSEVIVGGQVPPGAAVSVVRVLFRDCDFTRGLAEAPVDSDGGFRVLTTIPQNATLGPHEIIVTGGDTSDSDHSPPTGNGVLNVDAFHPAGITGYVSAEKANGAFIKVSGASVLLIDLFLSMLHPPYFVVATTQTDANGMFHFSRIKPGIYLARAAKTGIVFKDEGFALKQEGQGALVGIVGKFVSQGAQACEAWKELNETKGNRLPMGADFSKAGVRSVSTEAVDIGTFVSMPGEGIPVINKFKTLIPASFLETGKQATVRFLFRRSDNGQVVKSVDAQASDLLLWLVLWTADVDMSKFPMGSYEVSAEVEGVCSEFLPSVTFTMIDHAAWFNSWVGKPASGPKVQFKSNPPRYELHGLLPAPAAFGFDEPIDLELVTLNNKVTFGIPVNETFFIDGRWKGDATAQAQITFLSHDFLAESKTYNHPSGGFANHTYALSTIHKDLGGICNHVAHLFFGIPELLDVYVDVSVCLGGSVDIDSAIKNDLGPNLTITPGAGLSIPVEAGAHLLLCRGSVTPTPTATLHLPITCDVVPSPSCGFDQPCLSVDLQVCYSVRCGICCGDHWYCPCVTVASGCRGPTNLLKWGCGGAKEMAAVVQVGNVPELVFFPSPSVASDGAGHALAVWMQEDPGDGTESDVRLLYSYYDGTKWTAGKPISGERPLIDMPDVVYLGPNRAMAVWEQNRLSKQEAEASDGARVFSNVELYYAIWDGQRWSTPAPITSNDTFDASPALAADASTGRAMLVWLSVNQPTGPLDLPDGFYYASFDGAQWSQPALIDPTSTGIDIQPTIRFDHRGQPVTVWMRDLDGNIGTSEDREIMMSRFEGLAWTGPETVPNFPTGAFMPSIAFDNDNNAIVVFVVPPQDPSTGRLGSGIGNGSELYSALHRGDRWEVVPVGESTYAEAPVVRVNPHNRAIIMYRQFSDGADVHASGDLATAVADLNARELQWTTGYLTADGLVNWEVAFDVDRQTSENFILNVKKTPGALKRRAEVAKALSQLPKGERVGGKVGFNRLGGNQVSFDPLGEGKPDISVASFVVPYAVDLALTAEDITISHPHPVEGETVMITASVRNAGLKATTNDAPFTVKFYEGDPVGGGAFLIGEQRVENPLPFNAAVSVSVPYTVQQGGRHTITVIVDEKNAVGESDDENNTAQVTVGQMPPALQLSARAEPEQKVISLGWTAPETDGIDVYQIFRSMTSGGLYEFVGDTMLTEFRDTLVKPGVTYYYVVVAVDVYGTRSAFSNEVKAELPQ